MRKQITFVMNVGKVKWFLKGKIGQVSRISYKLACAYREDSNQSAYLHSLIRVIVFCLKKSNGPLPTHRVPISALIIIPIGLVPISALIYIPIGPDAHLGTNLHPHRAS